MQKEIKDMDKINKSDMASEPSAPYTMEELNARIDEAEIAIDKGEGKSFEEMMDGFRKELLWLK